MKPTSEYAEWPLGLREAWAELTHAEQACLIRERCKWRATRPPNLGNSRIEKDAPPPARDGAAYFAAHVLMYEQEYLYRLRSDCRGWRERV